MKAMCTVSFRGGSFPPMSLPAGARLSQHLTVQNSPVLFGCRTGICATCLIRVDGDLPPPEPDERELLDVMAPDDTRARLACQLTLRGDIEIERPDKHEDEDEDEDD